MLESDYQAILIKKIKQLLPGCLVLKNDSGYMQGIPDLSIFFINRYAFLEVKAWEFAPQQPNQEYYVKMLDAMSFAAFIYPENEKEVLDALQQSLATGRPTRIPERK